MSRIDFYLLAEADERARERFACRLAEKAYRLRHSVHIHAPDRAGAVQLDELLWTFRDGSFVPHQLTETGEAPAEAPITIGWTGPALRPADLLINLSEALPPELGSFPRVAEIVTSGEERKQRSRALFSAYRSQGHTLEIHELA